ncbi:MAG: glycoside hydrolase family 16 protein [Pseudonocardia sp.]
MGAGGSDPGREGDQTTIDTSTSPDTGTGKDTSAAERHGWGKPNRVDDFSDGTEQWNVYDGPGHAGQGTRSPSAVSIQDGILTITGDPSGTTAGMAWNSGQKYGRWEARVRVPAVDSSYSPVLLLWPDAENFPAGGEIDFLELLNPIGLTANIFIHYGADNLQINGQVEIDTTEWHNWALEWTPEAITAYVDGEEWYRTTDTSVFPTGPMHLAIQLDWFPQGGASQGSAIQTDWVKQYPLDGSINSEGGKGFHADPSTESGSAVAGAASVGSGDSAHGAQTTSVREALWRMFFWWW